ncbi:hypothetical protein BDQ12DRAFT_672084 [Crucibulum laeve]|uniref:Uncharacterized protein n=1 Tax=Crucibulum laeve TaxID=68775 RepID=A0A5C3LG51_9AGAR|nr:hypothetical protein BDQ12DRAFT_672087 [Crucibulum laeve]TFK31153.1 hypothetical protein BDQ12DRAFT_672084 [Crucibulum laeve]
MMGCGRVFIAAAHAELEANVEEKEKENSAQDDAGGVGRGGGDGAEDEVRIDPRRRCINKGERRGETGVEREVKKTEKNTSCDNSNQNSLPSSSSSETAQSQRWRKHTSPWHILHLNATWWFRYPKQYPVYGTRIRMISTEAGRIIGLGPLSMHGARQRSLQVCGVQGTEYVRRAMSREVSLVSRTLDDGPYVYRNTLRGEWTLGGNIKVHRKRLLIARYILYFDII